MRIYTSTTGTNWVTNLVTGFELTDVAYGNNTFAAVGFHDVGGPNISAVSTDGIHWSTNSLPRQPDGARFVNLTFGGGWFVAWGLAGRILSSRDGISWTLHQFAPGISLDSAVPSGLAGLWRLVPALKRRAIVDRPSGTYARNQ